MLEYLGDCDCHLKIPQVRFVARGPKRPEDEAKLFALRTKRVHRRLVALGTGAFRLRR